MRYSKRLSLLGSVMLALLISQQAVADNRKGNSSRIMTLDEAVENARSQYNGRVISADSVNPGVYDIRMLGNDGRVKRFRYDSSSQSSRPGKSRR